MAITNLTGYKWVGNQIVDLTAMVNTATPRKTFYVNSQRDTGYGILEYDFLWFTYIEKFKIYGFVGGNDDTLYQYDSWSYEYPLGATLTFTGGVDATNTELIAWLEANGTLTKPLTLNDHLTRIENAKSDIISAIREKGVDVPEGTLLSDMASYIAAISDANYKLTKSEDGTTIILQKTDEETEQSSVTDNDTVPETISDTELNTILTD